MDFILWMMSPALGGSARVPTSLTSSGSLAYFKRSRKPAEAAGATNCLSCDFESQCIYSAKRIYVDHHLVEKGVLGWPLDIVVPDIEETWRKARTAGAKDKLLAKLKEDYDETTTPQEIHSRPWFGRCVYESTNDVCDDQMVTFQWEDSTRTENLGTGSPQDDRVTKIASFHMVAFTEKQCERRGRIYGSRGEIEYDGTVIRLHDFATQKTREHYPHREGGGHGGGDFGLTRQYVRAIHVVKQLGVAPRAAQKEHIGATLEDMIRSHVLCFAAEDARKGKKTVACDTWLKENFADET